MAMGVSPCPRGGVRAWGEANNPTPVLLWTLPRRFRYSPPLRRIRRSDARLGSSWCATENEANRSFPFVRLAPVPRGRHVQRRTVHESCPSCAARDTGRRVHPGPTLRRPAVVAGEGGAECQG